MDKKIEQEIRKLADKNGGKVTPEMVVEAARSEKSPLHPYFDWDDKSAAHKYRLEIARKLIRSITFVVETETTTYVVPRYVKDPDVPAEQGYVSVARIMSDRERAKRVIKTETAYAAAAMNRARSLAGVLALEAMVDEALLHIHRVAEHAEHVTA